MLRTIWDQSFQRQFFLNPALNQMIQGIQSCGLTHNKSFGCLGDSSQLATDDFAMASAQDVCTCHVGNDLQLKHRRVKVHISVTKVFAHGVRGTMTTTMVSYEKSVPSSSEVLRQYCYMVLNMVLQIDLLQSSQWTICDPDSTWGSLPAIASTARSRRSSPIWPGQPGLCFKVQPRMCSSSTVSKTTQFIPVDDSYIGFGT